MFRPAKEHPKRATMTNLHLDMNPWNYIEGSLLPFFLALVRIVYYVYSR
jgi:hypothetical protein